MGFSAGVAEVLAVFFVFFVDRVRNSGKNCKKARKIDIFSEKTTNGVDKLLPIR